jgi:8-oxo-dGTP pyrophosphatase MutT (NUDIX family)
MMPSALNAEGTQVVEKDTYPIEYASIFIIYEDKIILVEDEGDGLNIPGGHSLEGEEPIATALRELTEETGICLEDQDLAHLCDIEVYGNEISTRVYIAKITDDTTVIDPTEYIEDSRDRTTRLTLVDPKDYFEAFREANPTFSNKFAEKFFQHISSSSETS